ncbi:Sec-independent protein translocase protein TatAd [Aquimixticola soesokkakensis]|uniref:Sec-independent protein translocase protein TatA n=1 Tax=Aquimixticola soesokkakensis TaxID=1519096 RepID=A0A1Y5S1A2_9RHOB|nr:twin-arginine translocase TatA/TatE family subunit [Aquimixticola soesokkakensis]SLN30198.1 Sec-independent protein translocase protein TatAd [Aquimixticola soesokkakensis]
MLNNIGIPGLLLIAVVVLVLFGRGKVSSLMGEVGKGITAFKKGVNDGDSEIEAEKQAAQAAADTKIVHGTETAPLVTPAASEEKKEV